MHNGKGRGIFFTTGRLASGSALALQGMAAGPSRTCGYLPQSPVSNIAQEGHPRDGSGRVCRTLPYDLAEFAEKFVVTSADGLLVE